MNPQRRSLLISSSVAAVGGMFVPGLPVLAQPRYDVSDQSLKLREQFQKYFEKLGYSLAAPAPMITHSASNGGLNYDDNLQEEIGSVIRIQPCARLDDINKKGKLGTLPLFTIAAAGTSRTGSKGDFIDVAIDFLTQQVGLATNQLSITTTSHAKAYLARLERLGIYPERIHFQSIEKAKSVGDGSGWFVHPVTNFETPTISIEYSRDGSTVEIGEISLSEAHRSDKPFQWASFGLERVVWAKTGHVPTWDGQLRELLAVLKNESEQTGRPLPAGYAAFAETLR